MSPGWCSRVCSVNSTSRHPVFACAYAVQDKQQTLKRRIPTTRKLPLFSPAQLSSLPFLFSARVIRLSRSQKSVLNFFRRCGGHPYRWTSRGQHCKFDRSSRARGAILIELQRGGRDEGSEQGILHSDQRMALRITAWKPKNG